MPLAGYCSTCKGYVWLTGARECAYGHPASEVRDIHAARSLPEPVGLPPEAEEILKAADTSQQTETGQDALDAADAVVVPTSPEPTGGAAEFVTPVTKESVDVLNRRIWAFALDYFIVFIVQLGIAAGAATTYVGLGGDPAMDTPLLDGIVLAMSVLTLYGYFTYMEGRFSTTFGKRFFGLRVVNKDGEAITWRQAVARNIGRFVDLWAFGIVGLLLAGFSSLRQRLGDRWARTYVVQVGTPRS